MKKKTTTSRYTMAEIDAMIARGDYYYNENPPPAEPLPEGFWKNAVVVEPRDRKCSVHLRIDPDVSVPIFAAQKLTAVPMPELEPPVKSAGRPSPVASRGSRRGS